MIVNALRIRAATAAEGAHADHSRVAESELLEGAAEAVPLDVGEEQRAVQKLSVLDAALRTLRLATLPEHGVKRQPKASGGSSRAPVSDARKQTSAPKAAHAAAAERVGPADTYERKGGKYVGQAQRWFFFRYAGPADYAEVDLGAQHGDPEFCEWRWAPLDARLVDAVVPFKRAVYAEVVRTAQQLLSKA